MSTTHPLAFLCVRKFLSGLVLLGGALATKESSNNTATKKAYDVEANNHPVDDDATGKRYKPGRTFSYQLKTYGKTFALLGLTLFGSQFGMSVVSCG